MARHTAIFVKNHVSFATPAVRGLFHLENSTPYPPRGKEANGFHKIDP